MSAEGREGVRGAVGSRWSRLGWRLALLIAGLLVVSAVATTFFSVSSLRDSLFDSASESMANVHLTVGDLVAVARDDVAAYRAAALEQRRRELADISAAMVHSIDALRVAISPDGANEEAARTAALDLLRSVRYRNDDYFFTLDPELVMIEHPNPAWDGRPVADFADPDGVYLFREMRDVVERDGSGFVAYRWERLGAEQPVPKISHVVPYAPWGWIIGTGVYLDDIEAEAEARMAATLGTLAETFENVSFGAEGLIFLLDAQGRVVAAPPSRDLTELSVTETGRELVARILAAAPAEEDVVTALTAKVPPELGPGGLWLVDLSAFPDLGWTLVSATPQHELERPGSELAVRQLVLAIVVLVCGLGIGLLATRRIVRPVTAMTAAAIDLENDRFDPASLDEAAARTDEVGALARAFRRMGAEVLERERRLREQVARLTVVVDRRKVDAEVGEITDTDFFRDLQSRAREMRRRDAAPDPGAAGEPPRDDGA
ncbi:MAG: cache domain-containing protein [Chloroflexota bacterium]